MRNDADYILKRGLVLNQSDMAGQFRQLPGNGAGTQKLRGCRDWDQQLKDTVNVSCSTSYGE